MAQLDQLQDQVLIQAVQLGLINSHQAWWAENLDQYAEMMDETEEMPILPEILMETLELVQEARLLLVACPPVALLM
jgi:hypothetical protein